MAILRISEKRYVYFAPTVRLFRLKQYKLDFFLRCTAMGEKGAPTAAWGKGETLFPRERFAWVPNSREIRSTRMPGRSSPTYRHVSCQ